MDPLMMLYGAKAAASSRRVERVRSSRTNATRLADELVDKGWVERFPCAEDRRQHDLHVSPRKV
jgi:DNA-binding MarR family transcriptional regulator